MMRALGVTEGRICFGTIIDAVQHRGDTVVPAKYGKTTAALISVILFEKFLKNREAAF